MDTYENAMAEAVKDAENERAARLNANSILATIPDVHRKSTSYTITPTTAVADALQTVEAETKTAAKKLNFTRISVPQGKETVTSEPIAITEATPAIRVNFTRLQLKPIVSKTALVNTYNECEEEAQALITVPKPITTDGPNPDAMPDRQHRALIRNHENQLKDEAKAQALQAKLIKEEAQEEEAAWNAYEREANQMLREAEEEATSFIRNAVRTAQGLKGYECAPCSRSFTTERGLLTHLASCGEQDLATQRDADWEELTEKGLLNNRY